MKYALPVSKHDDFICKHIGAALGQPAGGWSIKHEYESDVVLLEFPDTITEADVDAAVKAYVPAEPVAVSSVKERLLAIDTTKVPDPDTAAVIEEIIGALTGA